MQIRAHIPTTPPAPTPVDRFEQVFLEEFLKHYNVKADSFSGGHGEEQFSSFLRREYAELLAGRIELNLGVLE